tara:strand:- start:908 stop:2134 length:1227 start_codon:yes stop_codon:yes gene_type:complete
MPTTWTKETIDLSIASSSLTVDSVKIDGTNIGHTDDTDLMALASGALTVNGTVTATGNITGTLATAAQTNITSVGTLSSLTTSGDVICGGDLTVNGGDITVNNMTSSGFIKCVATEGNSAALELWADEGDDNGDKWQMEAAADNTLYFYNDASGSWVSKLKVLSSGNTTIAGDLFVEGGDLTLGSVVYLSDSGGTGTLKNIDALDATTEATIEAAMDTLANVSSIGGDVTIGGDLTITGGDIDLSGEASTITLIDNTASALIIGSPGKTDLFTINTNDNQETVAIDADRTSAINLTSGGLTLSATGSGITGSQTNSNLGGIYFKPPTFINQSGSNTIGQHSYIKIDDANITNVSGTATITDVCLLDLENNLGTSNSCTTNSDKTGNTKSGTIKVNVNGTIYHIQLYAN